MDNREEKPSHPNQSPEYCQEAKRKRTQNRQNKQLPRYECFCSKKYLSYPALYLHLKNKHLHYFQTAKNGKRMEPTKLVESVDSDGFKVFKFSIDPSLDPMRRQNQFFPQFSGIVNNSFESIKHLTNEGLYFGNVKQYQYLQPSPFLGFPPNFSSYEFNHMSKNQVNEEASMVDNESEEKESNIEETLSQFVDSLARRSNRQKMQAELILKLFVDCLNMHYDMLQDEAIEDREIKRYTSEYTCEKIFEMSTYFVDTYLKEFIETYQNNESFAFFIQHCSLIKKNKCLDLLKDLQLFYTQSPNIKSKPSHQEHAFEQNARKEKPSSPDNSNQSEGSNDSQLQERKSEESDKKASEHNES